jgi:hypothetical protein
VNWLELVRRLLLFLHLVGFTLLFGAFVTQYLSGRFRINVVMRTGLGTMIGTGLILAIPFPSGEHPNYLKLGIKLLIALGIGALFGVAVTRERRAVPIHRTHFLTVGGLILLNAAIAVFWQ